MTILCIFWPGDGCLHFQLEICWSVSLAIDIFLSYTLITKTIFWHILSIAKLQAKSLFELLKEQKSGPGMFSIPRKSNCQCFRNLASIFEINTFKTRPVSIYLSLVFRNEF